MKHISRIEEAYPGWMIRKFQKQREEANKNKEPMDESNVDWSDFGDVWWKKYQTGLEKGIPSEIKGDKTADELMDYLFGGMGKR